MSRGAKADQNILAPVLVLFSIPKLIWSNAFTVPKLSATWWLTVQRRISTVWLRQTYPRSSDIWGCLTVQIWLLRRKGWYRQLKLFSLFLWILITIELTLRCLGRFFKNLAWLIAIRLTVRVKVSLSLHDLPALFVFLAIYTQSKH